MSNYPDATGWAGPGHARLGDACPVCPNYLDPKPKLIAVPQPGGFSRLNCERCGAGSYGLHYPPVEEAPKGNVVTAAFGKPKPNDDDEGSGPHLQAPARCLRCKHEWRAVCPVGVVAGLECSACGCYTGVLTSMIEPEGERWACSCECQLFFLDRIGPPVCASCGVRAQSWVDA